MKKLNEKDVVAIIDERIKEDRKAIQLEAEISVCESILELIRNINNEIKTLDDLDTFICAMIINRKREYSKDIIGNDDEFINGVED